jgi:hypothetical protein
MGLTSQPEEESIMNMWGSCIPSKLKILLGSSAISDTFKMPLPARSIRVEDAVKAALRRHENLYNDDLEEFLSF